MTNYPDYWLIIKFNNNGETVLKVLGSWIGGYAKSDFWQLNSGIKSVGEFEGQFSLLGCSGSIYVVPKSEHTYRTTVYTSQVLNNMQEQIGANMEVLCYNDAIEELRLLKANVNA